MRYNDALNNKKISNNSLFLYHSGAEDFSLGAAFHTWDTQRIPSSNFYNLEGYSEIYLHVNCQGYYKISFEGSFDALTESQIFLNGAGISYAISKGYHNSITIIYYLGLNDVIQVQSDGGNSIANSCRIIMEKIE